ncbi:hypothetical protein EON62_04675 [archaeon]|nr:MAG: hypothetical protein EON62_04675 [archaeon]
MAALITWTRYVTGRILLLRIRMLVRLPACMHGIHARVAGVNMQAGVERMLKELKDTEDRRAKFSRRRAIDEDAGVDYINESNRRFNKRLEHAYGKFTVEAKQNVERGSAL